MQHELVLSHHRISELEEEKHQYQDHLDELILTVAKRSQNIRDIEMDLEKISAWQASHQDNSFDSEEPAREMEVYQATPENESHHQVHCFPLSHSKPTHSMQNVSPFPEERLIDSEADGAYSEHITPSYFNSPQPYKSSKAEPSSLSPPKPHYIILDSNQKEFSEIEALKRSVESLEWKQEVEHLQTKIESPQVSQTVEELRLKLKRKSIKLREARSMLELKAKQLNMAELDLSQLRLSLKLIKNSYCSRLRSELEGIKRDIATHSKLI